MANQNVTVPVSNNLINSLRKPSSSLLCNKVFLTALLNVQNRSGVPQKEAEYYKKLEQVSGTDFSHGLVAEMSNASIRRIMNSKSGSYYDQIQKLLDANNPDSLRNQWVILIKDKESNLFGTTELITATLYDRKEGKIFIKFSSEQKVQKEIWGLKKGFSKLNYHVMMNFKSNFAYRIYSIMMSRIGIEDGITGTKRDEYSFNYGLSELKYLVGVLNPFETKDVSKFLSEPFPDYEKIEKMVSDECKMPRYNDFNKYALTKAKKEIDEQTEWIFTYEPIRSGRGGKVTGVELIFTKKKMIEKHLLNEEERLNFIDTIQDLISFPLKVKELKEIAEASNYDLDKVKKAIEVLDKTPKVSNVVGFLINAIKNDYEVPISKNEKNSTFNSFEKTDYDFDEIEKIIN